MLKTRSRAFAFCAKFRFTDYPHKIATIRMDARIKHPAGAEIIRKIRTNSRAIRECAYFSFSMCVTIVARPVWRRRRKRSASRIERSISSLSSIS